MLTDLKDQFILHKSNAKNFMLSKIYLRERVIEITKNLCFNVQVQGSSSTHAPAQTQKPSGLLASQFLLLDDSNDDNKLVTCAICMAVFFSVSETIGEAPFSVLISQSTYFVRSPILQGHHFKFLNH